MSDEKKSLESYGNSIGSANAKKQFRKKSDMVPSVEQLSQGIINRDRSALARAITLVESNSPHHFDMAQSLLQKLSPYSGSSIRVGITGVPGAGKSTFIESLGMYLCSEGFKVAVLAVDPSSSINGGSILGDKTRMEQLSRNPRAFIRPSPTGGRLGGVHRKTRESILLCEAAGFDVILVETVGVGQSEISVREMVDFFILLVLTGAGDELQGMKKGIIEIADAIVVNKADGQNKPVAEKTSMEYNRILHFLQPATKGWLTQAYPCSARTNEGIPDIWKVVSDFEKRGKEEGFFEERRKVQTKDWFYSVISDQLHSSFFMDSNVKALLPGLVNDVLEGETTPPGAAQLLINTFLNKNAKN